MLELPAYFLWKDRQGSRFDIGKYCFKEQLDFINDEARFKTAVCSRRAGKTIACAVDLLNTALSTAGVVCLYITLSRKNAERIIWPELLKLNIEYRLGGKTNETKLTMRFPNGSIIYVSGAKDKTEIENFRGLPIKKVYIDECFHPDSLVETIGEPKRIADIQVGDQVKNAMGYGYVTQVSRKRLDKSIELFYAGKRVKCSLNHPFFTERGWVEASQLKIGDQLVSHSLSVRTLCEGYRSSPIWESEASAFLFSELRREVGSEFTEVYRSHEESQSSIGSKDLCKDPGSQEKYFLGSGDSKRQRARSYGSGKGSYPKVSGPHLESCNTYETSQRDELSNLLQGGPLLPGNPGGDRDRWELSLQSQGTRQEEGQASYFIRLDGIEIHESGSDDGNPEGYYYDLSVSGHPSYCVGGVIVHNCQSFRNYIADLVDDVLSKALFDYNGTLCLIGTPGLVPAGYFYECAHSGEWHHSAWTMFQNPHLERKSGKTVQALVEEDCRRMGVGLDHPKIQRECYGRWVVDLDSLVFKYDASMCDYSELPQVNDWEYVIGVDLGYDDADAISVIGWSTQTKEAYLIEEDVRTKQGITELAARIGSYVDTYDPISIVMDTGGLGKKIAEEIQRKHSLGIKPAEKSEKFAHIEMLNDAMRTGRFKAKKTSRFAQDCQLVEYDFDKSTGDRYVISDRYHSDICDSTLYAFREALHWLYEEPKRVPQIGTPEWAKAEVRRMEQDAIDRYESEKAEIDFWAEPGLNGG